MDDNRTMAQLLEAPTVGYEDAFVVPEITADNFELKHDHFCDEVPERPEYVDRSITKPIGIAEDVYLKVGKFKFLADFVVVDFDADPRVPLILGRSFLKIGRALIDVYEGELTLRVGKEAITFNLDQTSRYSSNYDEMTANRIDVIEMACEEYSQEVLGFSDEVDAFLALEDDPTSPEFEDFYYDP
ncbi:reverse transcriptase domain-containing protein [Tanacetum coccineum]